MAAPAFSRRHYEYAAAVLAVVAEDVIRAKLVDADETWRACRDGFAVMFAEDNPRFNDARFADACIPRPPFTTEDDDDAS
jgi:hypothetical protein